MQDEPATLLGRHIRLWMAREMALTNDEQTNEVTWTHPDIPYLQFIRLDAVVDGGEVISIFSRLEDGSGSHGLFCADPDTSLRAVPTEPGSIYRVREVSELPIGKVTSVDQVKDETGSVVESRIGVAGKTIGILSGEVYEESGGQFRIGLVDESLLVTVNNHL